jgi:hypothetical protein
MFLGEAFCLAQSRKIPANQPAHVHRRSMAGYTL